jgi:predicted CoA-binding protein
VDIVHIFRPAEEHPDIIARHVVPLAAKAIWLQPPITSTESRRIAADRGLAFVEGREIVEMTQSMGTRKPDSA